MDSSAKLPSLRIARSGDSMKSLQLPLNCDNVSMIMQFEKCIACDHQNAPLKSCDSESVAKMYQEMSREEVARALLVKNADLLNHLAHAVTCVGCRRSVERLFQQLVKSRHPALEPIVVLSTSELTLQPSYFSNPDALCRLFSNHGIETIAETVLKNKKNKRCNLHSLETHKSRTTGVFNGVCYEAWEIMSDECRENLAQIDFDSFNTTLDTYLRKHRFCAECKSKVQLAYSILIGERDSSKEKGYCHTLYENLKACPSQRHIHVSPTTEFITQLIEKAEPELIGTTRRDRHAKTLDIAQEEVLTCLGIHIYERLHRLWQKVKTENQTWTILFNLGVDSLKKSFMMAQEQKRGISNLELICQQMEEEERLKVQRLELKRLRKKKKKCKNANENENMTAEDMSLCQHSTSGSQPLQSWSSNCENGVCGLEASKCASCETCGVGEPLRTRATLTTLHNSDCGYSSGPEGCESCSMPSSNDGSDIACSEGICTHDGGDCTGNLLDTFEPCETCLEGQNSPKWRCSHDSPCSGPCSQCTNKGQTRGRAKQGLSLLNYYYSICHCSSDEDDCEGDGISEEDIQRFKAANGQRQRLQLRETLRQRFQDFQESARPHSNGSAMIDY